MWTTETQAALSPPIVDVRPRRRLSLAGDERLARLIKDGSEAAFAVLYERYHQRLYRYCRSMLHNDADAQDALQSTFAGAYAALADGRRDAPMRPWLYRIAYNESVSLLRRRRPEAPLVEADGIASASAEHEASERARLAQLVADLGALAERQRGALVMRELSGLSHEEIGVALGVSVGAAKQTIFEARQSLAEFAEGRAMACEDVCRAVSDGNGRVLRGRKIRAHLRDCAACAAFADAIPARSRDLRAIAPPLSMFAAASLLRRALGAGSSHGTGSGAGVAAGAAGKTAAVAVTAKAVASVAVVATAAVGVTGVVRSLDRSPSHPAPTAARSRRAPVAPAQTTLASAPGGGAKIVRQGTALSAMPAATHAARGSTGRALGLGHGRGHAPKMGLGKPAVHSNSIPGQANGKPIQANGKSIRQHGQSAPVKRAATKHGAVTHDATKSHPAGGSHSRSAGVKRTTKHTASTTAGGSTHGARQQAAGASVAVHDKSASISGK